MVSVLWPARVESVQRRSLDGESRKVNVYFGKGVQAVETLLGIVLEIVGDYISFMFNVIGFFVRLNMCQFRFCIAN